LNIGPFFVGDVFRVCFGDWDFEISSVLQILRENYNYLGLKANTFSHLQKASTIAELPSIERPFLTSTTAGLQIKNSFESIALGAASSLFVLF
jgi:hypothetical protein